MATIANVVENDRVVITRSEDGSAWEVDEQSNERSGVTVMLSWTHLAAIIETEELHAHEHLQQLVIDPRHGVSLKITRKPS